MTCTSCRKSAPDTGEPKAEQYAGLLEQGWFIWSPRSALRFHGVVLCPKCRQLPVNQDSRGRKYPTPKLERLASESAPDEDVRN